MTTSVSAESLDLNMDNGYIDHGIFVNRESAERVRIIEIDGMEYPFSPVSEALHEGIMAMFSKKNDGVTNLE